MQEDRIGQRLWQLPHHPLLPDEIITLDWGRLLPMDVPNSGGKARLKRSIQSYFSALADEGNNGKPYAPTTLRREFSDLQILARWMARQKLWQLSALSLEYILKFLQSREPRQGSEMVSDRTLATWMTRFQRMWNLRDRYAGAIRIEVAYYADEIQTQVRGKRLQKWRALPDHVAFALIRDALDWIEQVGPILVAYLREYANLQESIKSYTNYERDKRIKNFFAKIENDPHFQALSKSIGYSGHVHYAISHAVSVLEGACLTFILLLVGMRISEVLALGRDCLSQPATLDFARYLTGPAAKKQGVTRRWAIGRPIDRAVELMIELGDIGRNDGSRALFIRRHSGSAVFWPAREAKRMNRDIAVRRISAFAVSGVRQGAIQAEKFHPHMARKTFAQLAVRRDRSLLEPVSAHLGHIYQTFTDGQYVGADYSLAQLLEEADRSELAASLEHLLTCGSVVGGGAAGLETIREEVKFKGKRALQSLIQKLIARGVKLAPCDWGFCVYSEVYSACEGDAVGPDEMKRSPDVCSGCHNFVVTERHRPWWEERALREERFLAQEGLSEQTASLVHRRLLRTRSVLRDVIWLNSPQTQP